MMTVLMYGFGSGNNIEPWLEFFNRQPDKFRLTFICKSFKFESSRFRHIEIIDISRTGKLSAIRSLRRRKYDVLYIQGLYDYLQIFFLFLLADTKTRILNIWNNHNYKKATRLNPKFWQRPFYRYLYRKADRIYFTWHGTLHDFSEALPAYSKKLYLQPWGIRDEIIRNEPEVKSEWTRSYLEKLDPETLFLFWPENISPEEHIDKVLEGLYNIGVRTGVKVLIFSGHSVSSSSYYHALMNFIREKHLDQLVEIKTGTYLPYEDIMALWKRADLSIKLSTKDQLSNGIIEGLFFETPLILNNWLPYIKLSESGMKVFLCELEPVSIGEKLELLISELRNNRDFFHSDGQSNRELVKQFFNFDKNITHLMKEIERSIS